jgi:dihydrodipicolinate synthase/N-acetylneuraminate lyase
MASRITGILTPHMVPLDDRNQVYKSGLRRYVDRLVAHDGPAPTGLLNQLAAQWRQ